METENNKDYFKEYQEINKEPNSVDAAVQQNESEDNFDASFVLQAIAENEQDLYDNRQTIEYSKQTGKPVPDYYSEFKSTISDTGTELDGQNVFEVANKKQATPKEIFNLWDTIVSVADGLRAAGVNMFATGAELTEAVFDPYISAIERAVGVNPEESKKESKETIKAIEDTFGGEETMESKSYSGAVAGTIAQIAGGGAPLKGIKAANIALKVAKTNAGRKAITGFINLAKEMTSVGTSFSENQDNFYEFVNKTFGMSVPEFVKKSEDDPDLVKRLKNTMDLPAAIALTKGTFKLAKKVFTPKLAATEKAITAVEKAEDVATRSGATGEEFSRITEETLKNRVKGFSDKELKAIVEKGEEAGIVSPGKLKEANRQVLENAVVNIAKHEKKAVSIGLQAREAAAKAAAGEMNDVTGREQAIKLWKELSDSFKSAKESISAPGQILEVASEAETYKYTNQAMAYVMENADRLDYKKMLEIMGKIEDPKGARAFLDAINGRVAKGKVSDILDKLAFIEQDMYLLSAGSRLKDAASTFGNLMLQIGETAFAGMVLHPTKKGIKLAISKIRPNRATEAGKALLTTLEGPQDMVYFGEALNMLHGTASMLLNAVYTAVRKPLEAKNILKQTPDTMFQKAIRQSVDANQSRLYLKREVKTNVASTNSKFGQFINNILNHGGIWAAEKIDDINQAIAYRAHLERNVGILARKNAAINKWTKSETKDFIRKSLIDSEKVEINPNKIYDFMNATTAEGQLEAAVRRSANEASVTTFRQPLMQGSWEAGLYGFINKTEGVRQVARVLFPFQKTSLKIGAEEFIRKRSGWGSIPYLRTQFAQGGRAQEEALSRVLLGVGIQGSAIALMMQDKMTGPRPKNQGEAALWDSEGRQEYSYKTENGWISYKDFAGPIGDLLVGATTIFDRIRRINELVDENMEEDWNDYLLQTPSILAEAALSETVLGNWLEAIQQGDVTYVEHTARSLATLAPAVISEMTNWKENQQITLTLLDEFERKWGIDTSVDKLDLFGNPIRAKTKKYSGYKYSESEENLVTDTMLYYGAFVEPPSKNVSVDNVKVNLSKEEVYQWQQIMGEKDSFGKMFSYITSREFANLPDTKRNLYGEVQDNKTKLLKEKYNELKRDALNELIKRNINVYNKYIEAKRQMGIIPTIKNRYENKKPTLSIK